MVLTVYWSQIAEDRLDDIFNYYKLKAGKSTAVKLVNGIVDQTIDLEKNPRLGQKEELLAERIQEFRFLIYKHYKIIYWINKHQNRIEIANIFDCRQNPVKIHEV